VNLLVEYEVRGVQVHKAGITGIAVVDGFIICTASLDLTIKLWNMKLQQVLFRIACFIVLCTFSVSGS